MVSLIKNYYVYLDGLTYFSKDSNIMTTLKCCNTSPLIYKDMF